MPIDAIRSRTGLCAEEGGIADRFGLRMRKGDGSTGERAVLNSESESESVEEEEYGCAAVAPRRLSPVVGVVVAIAVVVPVVEVIELTGRRLMVDPEPDPEPLLV